MKHWKVSDFDRNPQNAMDTTQNIMDTSQGARD